MPGLRGTGFRSSRRAQAREPEGIRRADRPVGCRPRHVQAHAHGSFRRLWRRCRRVVGHGDRRARCPGGPLHFTWCVHEVRWRDVFKPGEGERFDLVTIGGTDTDNGQTHLHCSPPPSARDGSWTKYVGAVGRVGAPCRSASGGRPAAGATDGRRCQIPDAVPSRCPRLSLALYLLHDAPVHRALGRARAKAAFPWGAVAPAGWHAPARAERRTTGSF
jgi:hypothetical protein